MRVTEEAPGLFRVPVHNPFGDPTNVYVIVGDQVCLVDVGPLHAKTWLDLVGGLRELGFRPEDVSTVVLTHGHADHDGLAHRFRWADVLVGKRDLVKIADYQAHLARYEAAVRQIMPRWGVPDTLRQQVPTFFARLSASGDDAPWARALTDGETIPGTSPPFVVVDLPGHTEGLIGLYRQKDSILLSSDQLLERIVPNPAFYFSDEPPGHGLHDYEHSLRRILALNVRRCLPGHGRSFAKCHEVAQRFLSQYEVRLTETLEILDRPQTVAMVSQALFPGCDISNSYHVFVTLVESFARLEVLRTRRAVARMERKGVFWYERM